MHEKKTSKNNFLSLARKKGRPNLVNDEMLQKIRDVIIGSRLAGTVISWKMVTMVQAGGFKANEVTILKEFGVSLELTKGWARNFLNTIDWLIRKGTNGKIALCAKFLEKEKILFQGAVSKFISEQDIPPYLVLILLHI